ncbi:hypothetical protein IFT43_17320 [Oxalobacteraceae sp. CFBP 13708]|nr:hypothetical protein [Oxalobacteraceae sp. CFBP 13708]
MSVIFAPILIVLPLPGSGAKLGLLLFVVVDGIVDDIPLPDVPDDTGVASAGNDADAGVGEVDVPAGVASPLLAGVTAVTTPGDKLLLRLPADVETSSPPPPPHALKTRAAAPQPAYRVNR